MPVKRTPYRITTPSHEMKFLYHVDMDNLPDNMELIEDGAKVAIYLSEEEFMERQGDLFPRCPVTGAFCNWDHDYNAIGDLF